MIYGSMQRDVELQILAKAMSEDLGRRSTKDEINTPGKESCPDEQYTLHKLRCHTALVCEFLWHLWSEA